MEFNLEKLADKRYTAKDVARLAGYRNDTQYALKSTDVSTIASRYGYRESPIASELASSAKKVRLYRAEQILYFAVINMLTYNDIDYSNAFDILQGFIKRKFLSNKLKHSSDEYYVIVRGTIGKERDPIVFGVVKDRRDLWRTTKSYLAKSETVRVMNVSRAIETALKRMFKEAG